jgi:hypothetical protein
VPLLVLKQWSDRRYALLEYKQWHEGPFLETNMKKCTLAGLLGLALSTAGLDANDTPTATGPSSRPQLQPAAFRVQEPAPAATAPKASITLYDRHGHVTPCRQGFQHTGAGNIDIAQPAADTLVITMTGVAVAGAHPCKDSVAAQDFDLVQQLEVSVDKPQSKSLKMTLEARVVGLLRSHHKGGVAEESGCTTIACGPAEIITLAVPSHSVSCGQNLSINDREGPIAVPIAPGKYTLHQNFNVAVRHSHTWLPCKAASAEFAPDPALDPLWISYFEPFHGANKRDFGLQVTIKVAAE